MAEQEKDEKSESKTGSNCNVRKVPDGGWGWLVSVAGFFVQFIILGLQNNVGLFDKAFRDHFQKSKFQTGWVSSLALGNMFLFAPVTSALCEKYSCRVIGFFGGLLTVVGMLASSFANNLYILYFTFGIVYGAGTSLCFLPTLRSLPYWFSRYLATATGIALAGSGVGTLAVGPLIEILILQFGWKNAARIFAGLLLIPTLAALVYRVPASSSNHCNGEGEKGHEKPKKTILDFSILKNRTFVSLCVAVSTFTLGYFVPFVYVPGYAQELNVSKKRSSVLVGLLSVGSIFGRLFFGRLSDRPGVNRLYLYQMSFLFMGIADFLVPLITDFTGFVIYMISFGIFDGCYVLLQGIAVNDVVGRDNISSGLGIKFFCMAITSFIGPPIAGWITEISGSYDAAFLATGGTSVAAFCLMFIVHWLMPKDVLARNRMTYKLGDEEMRDKQQQHGHDTVLDLTTPSIGKINDAMYDEPTSTDDSSTVKSPQSLDGHAESSTKRASLPDEDSVVIANTQVVDVQLNSVPPNEIQLSEASS